MCLSVNEAITRHNSISEFVEARPPHKQSKSEEKVLISDLLADFTQRTRKSFQLVLAGGRKVGKSNCYKWVSLRNPKKNDSPPVTYARELFSPLSTDFLHLLRPQNSHANDSTGTRGVDALGAHRQLLSLPGAAESQQNPPNQQFDLISLPRIARHPLRRADLDDFHLGLGFVLLPAPPHLRDVPGSSVPQILSPQHRSEHPDAHHVRQNQLELSLGHSTDRFISLRDHRGDNLFLFNATAAGADACEISIRTAPWKWSRNRISTKRRRPSVPALPTNPSAVPQASHQMCRWECRCYLLFLLSSSLSGIEDNRFVIREAAQLASEVAKIRKTFSKPCNASHSMCKKRSLDVLKWIRLRMNHRDCVEAMRF